MSTVVGATEVTGNLPGAEVASAARQTEGSFRGENVQQVRDPNALLQDAAEELSFGESERSEKKLSQRKLSAERGARTEAIEQIEQYLKDVPDLEKNQKLSDFVQSMLERKPQPNEDELRGGAGEFSDDETHQFIALGYLRDQALERGADAEFVAAVEGAISSLKAEKGPAIQVGLNVSGVAQQFSSESLGDIQQLRDFYRDIVLDCSSIRDAYQRITKDHPDKEFSDAVKFMLNALATDLDATPQSVSKGRLRQIMDDMYQLKALNSVHGQCGDLLSRIDRNFGTESSPTATTNLLSELLSAQDRAWQGADAFGDLPGKMGLEGSDAEIYFLQGFKELVRFVPLKAFGDEANVRDRVMIAVQQALDVAIDNEEYDD